MANHITDHPPQQLGKYRLVEPLKEGGEARVYKGTDSTGKVVAIRVLKIHENTEDVQRRFRREVENLKKLHGHPHIILLEDFGLVEGWAYLVMQYIPGGSLGDLLKRGRQFSFNEVLTFLQQTADALSYAHERGVIHRDVKPDNLLCGSNGILLSDFGIAFDAGTDSTLTRETAGSFHFQAPEQSKGKPVFASDQYSLAATGCYLITKKHVKLDRQEVLKKVSKEWSPEIAEVFTRALKDDPDERFSSIKDFASALDRAVLSEITKQISFPPLPSPAPSPRRPHFLSHAITSLIMAVLTLLLVFALVRLPWGFLPNPSRSEASAPSEPTNIIKIGVDLPLSGNDTHDGQPVLNAIELAIAQAKNSIPGYTLELNVRDDVGANNVHDPVMGMKNIRSIINDPRVAAIIGPFNSDVAQAELPIANQAHIAMISPSTTSPCLTVGGPPNICTQPISSLRPTGQITFFRTAASNDIEGTKLADYLFNIQHYKTAYVINDPGPYGLSFSQAFENKWHSLTGTTPIAATLPATTTQHGYEDFINAISAIKPDVVFYAGNTPNATLIHTLMEQNPQLATVAFAGGGGIINASFVTNIEGLQSGPVYAITPVGDIIKTTGALNGPSFYTSYISTYNDQPTPYSASAYDCTNIVIDAIKIATANTSPTNSSAFRQQITSALQNNISYDGVTGHYNFNNSGDPANPTVSLYRLNTTNQRWEYIPTT